jgi:hypothetical protein
MTDLCEPNRFGVGRLGLLAGLGLLALSTVQPAQALVINVTYPNPGNVPAAAMSEINNVVALLDSSFINNATVNITVDFTANCGLGCSNTLGFLNMPYSSWRGAMINDAASNPQNTFLNSAVLTLPAADPIGNGTMSFVRSANAEAIGLASFSGNDSALTFTNDGVTFEYTYRQQAYGTSRMSSSTNWTRRSGSARPLPTSLTTALYLSGSSRRIISVTVQRQACAASPPAPP